MIVTPKARQLFDQAEEVTALPLKRLCFEGPMEELTQTVNLQPAVTMLNMALYNALVRAGVQPAYVAGHSLGEYSALYAAGVLSEAETLKAVKMRGQLMHREAEKHPGTMAAVVGLPIAQVVELLSPVVGRGYFALANYNTPEQLVISGAKVEVEEAMALVKAGRSQGRSPGRVRGLAFPVDGWGGAGFYRLAGNPQFPEAQDHDSAQRQRSAGDRSGPHPGLHGPAVNFFGPMDPDYRPHSDCRRGRVGGSRPRKTSSKAWCAKLSPKISPSISTMWKIRPADKVLGMSK